MNTSSAIEQIVGEDWNERLIVCRNRGPMREVFVVPLHEEPPEDGSEYGRWDVWWVGDFDGHEHGAHIKLAQGQPHPLDECAQMLYEQACMTMDYLADDAVGYELKMEMVYLWEKAVAALMADGRGTQEAGLDVDELHWLLYPSDLEDAVADDSYWLARADMRLSLQRRLEEVVAGCGGRNTDS